MSFRHVLSFGVVLFLGTTSLVWAQDNIQQNENLPRLPPLLQQSPNHSDVFVDNNQVQKEQEARFAAMRQEEIKRDSDKLFELSAQLKDQIDKSNGNILSVETLKMVQQIEKLAHGLKQRIKD